MKKFILMLLLAIVACSPEPVEDAVAEVVYKEDTAITDDLRAQIASLIAENASLTEEINKAMNDYANALITLDELSDIISGLEEEVKALTVAAVLEGDIPDGRYKEVEYGRSYDGGKTFLPSNEPYLFDIVNKEVLLYGYPHSLQNASSIQGLHKFTSRTFEEDANHLSVEVKIVEGSIIVHRIAINSLGKYSTMTFKLERVGDSESPLNRKFFTSEREYTPGELNDIYREKGLGFYSDPIYAQIDPRDERSILKAFVEDAKRNGLDLNYALNETMTFEKVDWNYGAAYATSCNTGKIEIYLEDLNYEELVFHDLNPFWVFIMFHELGHGVLDLQHNRVTNDIMYSTSEEFPGAGPDVNNGYASPNDIDGFKEATARLFSSLNQYPYDCNSNAGKGSNLITN